MKLNSKFESISVLFILCAGYLHHDLFVQEDDLHLAGFQGVSFDENNEKAFYDSDSEEKRDETETKPYMMDPDHRLLLRNTKPLLQSRNTAVSTLENCTHLTFEKY